MADERRHRHLDLENLAYSTTDPSKVLPPHKNLVSLENGREVRHRLWMIKESVHLKRLSSEDSITLCVDTPESIIVRPAYQCQAFYLIRPGTARSNLRVLSALFHLVYPIDVRMKSKIRLYSSYSRLQETTKTCICNISSIRQTVFAFCIHNTITWVTDTKWMTWIG